MEEEEKDGFIQVSFSRSGHPNSDVISFSRLVFPVTHAFGRQESQEAMLCENRRQCRRLCVFSKVLLHLVAQGFADQLSGSLFVKDMVERLDC